MSSLFISKRISCTLFFYSRCWYQSTTATTTVTITATSILQIRLPPLLLLEWSDTPLLYCYKYGYSCDYNHNITTTQYYNNDYHAYWYNYNYCYHDYFTSERERWVTDLFLTRHLSCRQAVGGVGSSGGHEASSRPEEPWKGSFRLVSGMGNKKNELLSS